MSSDRRVQQPPSVHRTAVCNSPGADGTHVVIALATARFGYAFMQTAVVPALGLLQRELDTTPTWTAWILSAFLLSSAVLTPLIARLGDLYGTRRVMLAVLATYAIGMAGAAVAQNIGQLIAMRIVQGCGLALVPLAFAIVRESVPERQRILAIGWVSGITGVGGGAGLVLGGLFADSFSWRYVFLFGALPAVVSFALVLRWVRPMPRKAQGRIDLPGGALLGIGLVAVLLALTQGPSWGWTSTGVLGIVASGIVCFAALFVVERKRADPLIDLGDLSDRPMVMTHAAAFVFGAVTYFFFLVLPLYAQQDPRPLGVGLGASATVSGLLMVPGLLVSLPAGVAVGWMARAFGPRWPLSFGFLSAVTGSGLLAVGHTRMWEHLVFYGFVGIGTGLLMASLPKLITDLVPLRRTATANGINNIIRNVGGVVGSQLAAAVIASGTSPTGAIADSAFTTVFWVAAGACVLGAVVSPFAVRSNESPARAHMLKDGGGIP